MVYGVWCMVSRTCIRKKCRFRLVRQMYVRIPKRKKMCLPFCTRFCIGVRGGKVKVCIVEVIVKNNLVHKKPFCLLVFLVFLFFWCNKMSLWAFYCLVKWQHVIVIRKVFLSDVLSVFQLTTNRSKQFCGLTLFGRKKKPPPSICVVVCLVSLAGEGRDRVFGIMVCVNQFED